MVAVKGLVGLRPDGAHVANVASPPYDVIKPGSELEAFLRKRPQSLYHVILGEDPQGALQRLSTSGAVVRDDEPCFYVYEQRFSGGVRTGVFVAGAVTPYAAGDVIRHEKTFDDKVRGRIRLAELTGHTFGPVFSLTRAPISALLEEAKGEAPVYEFSSDFGGSTDLHGIHSRVWRVPEKSPLGTRLTATLAEAPVYIADGHHRYHAALKYEQSHFLGYITEAATILAYNRVLRGRSRFSDVKDQFSLEPVTAFATPPKHQIAIYSRDGIWRARFAHVPEDVVGRLDCACLEREFYGPLGLSHEDIADPAHFDYYPESALEEMKAAVDRGEYDVAVALHPVSFEELIAVADAGLRDPNIVMPEKSTFFSPKILSGLLAYRHEKRG